MRKSRQIESNKVIYFLLFFIVGIMPLSLFPVSGIMSSYLSKYIMMFIPMTLFVFTYLTHRKEIELTYQDSESKALLAYFSLMVISTVFSVAPFASVFGSNVRLDGIITFGFYIITFLIAKNSKYVGSWLFITIIYTSLLVSIFGILQYYRIDPIPVGMYLVPIEGSAFSTMGNQNFLGSYLVLVIPVSLYHYFINGKKFGLFAYGIQFLTLLCTNTRGAWIGAFSVLLIFLLLYKLNYGYSKQFLKKVIYTVFTSIIIVVFYTVTTGDAFLVRLLSIFIDFSKFIKKGDDSFSGGSNRIYIWQKVIELIKMRPIFGFGVETLGVVMDKFYKTQTIIVFGRYVTIDKAHNEYLHIAVSSGIPSLIAYLSFLYLELKKAFQRLKENPAYTALLSAVIGYLIQAFFNVQVINVYYLFFAYLGLISSNTAFAIEKSESNIENQIVL